MQISTKVVYGANERYKEIDSLLRQIIDRLKGEMQQLQPNSPNIVAIRVHNILMSAVKFDVLRIKLNQFLEEQRSGDLSGIAIETDIENALFVSNPYAKHACILSKSEIQKVGFEFL